MNPDRTGLQGAVLWSIVFAIFILNWATKVHVHKYMREQMAVVVNVGKEIKYCHCVFSETPTTRSHDSRTAFYRGM